MKTESADFTVARNSTRLLIPLLVIILLITGLSWLVQHHFETHTRQQTKAQLLVLIDAMRDQIESWHTREKKRIHLWSEHRIVVDSARKLLTVPRTQEALIGEQAQQTMRDFIVPVLKKTDHQGFYIIAPDGTNIASSRDVNIGKPNLLSRSFLQQILQGKTLISIPQPSDIPLKDASGKLVGNLPTMFSAAPIYDESGEVIAILSLRQDPRTAELNRMLQRIRFGTSGETYGFDKNGLMVTRSRFNDHLYKIGLLQPGEESILKIRVCDPGGNMVEGYRPSTPLSKCPLTLMAANAVQGQSGLNIEGYNDYRGVPVVGAWMWDPELQLGVTTEIDIAEVYAAPRLSRRLTIFLTLFSILSLLILGGIFWREDRAGIQNEITLNQRVEARTRELLEVEKSKNAFLSGMTHELRTPMNAILGFAQILEMEEQNQETVQCAQSIYSAGEYLLGLINEVLDFSRIEAGKIDVNLESVSLNGLIEECMQISQPLADKRNIVLREQITSHSDHMIRTDRTRLKQVLLNLISNAIKYNTDDNIVEIYCSAPQAKRLRISVKDSGIGIPPEKHHRIFKPYERIVDDPAKIEGTGLGLVITKQLVELMGGTIGFRSVPGKGSTFWIDVECIGEHETLTDEQAQLAVT